MNLGRWVAIMAFFMGGSLLLPGRVPDSFLDTQAELFFGNPKFHSLTVNRAGSAMAMIRRSGDEEYLAIYDFIKDEGFQQVTRSNLSVWSFDWVDDQTLMACYVDDHKYFNGLFAMSPDFRLFREIGASAPDHLTRVGTSGPYAASIGGQTKRILVPQIRSVSRTTRPSSWINRTGRT